jgi:hypothetical protein
MQIGCQNHTHDAWTGFDDAAISAMADGAPKFWTAHKTMLMTLCAIKAKEV